ncbi:MAG TPA: MerR family transcriptional regulator [Nitriliruptorales bacterium]
MGLRRKRMTIDELAHETGVSSRNIRYYQTRGLLPAPDVEGRTGYYGKEHVERLRLIQDMQGEGVNLQAMSWLLGGAGSVDSDEVRRLKRAVLDGWVTDQPIEVDLEHVLGDVDPTEATEENTRRAIKLGMVEPTEDPQRWRVRLPSVLAAGRELNGMGVAASRSLDALERMREHLVPIAQEFVKLFDEAVLAPWDARGRPADEWPAIREAVDRIRPLAGEAVLAVFNQMMADAVAQRLEESVVPEQTPDDA